ncbi:MAG TPA: transglutaminase-like cysteine peptidase [Dongiaceae bacterium]
MISCPPFMRRQRRICVISAALAGAMIFLASAFAPAASAASNSPADSIFGTKELHSSNLNMFPKWRDALRRFDTELKTCAATACKAKEWNAFIDGVRNSSREEQVRAVNREMNDKPYVTDPVNWHMADYWATPLQFLRKDGDCEDYAISKYMALKALGFRVEDLRIVVLQDTNLGVPHAVLVVFLQGRALVLDNQVSGIVPADSIHHYHPYYSINEDGWWLHRS